MTEQNAGRPRAEWPREGRTYSATPKPIPPHPEFGGRPPCESGISSSRPCKRDASILYHGMYVCDEHFGWMQATQDHDEAERAVYLTRRMLWRAQVEDVPRLEHHVTQALDELEEEERRVDELAIKALDRAQGDV